jgi:tetratricopeptide (TPR) repeat protein
MITNLDPSFTEAYSLGAWLLWSAGRDTEAIAVYRKAIAANPKNWEPAFDFGMYWYGKRNFAEAESNLALATQNSAPSTVWKMLAHAREKLGRLPEALAAWDKVKELDRSDPVIEQNVRRILKEMEKRVE